MWALQKKLKFDEKWNENEMSSKWNEKNKKIKKNSIYEFIYGIIKEWLLNMATKSKNYLILSNNTKVLKWIIIINKINK